MGKGSLETPTCEVVSTFDGGEVRSYGAGLLWATTRVEGSYSDASYQGFERCFAYISGTNDQNATIEMTGPVRIQPLDETSSTWKVSFFVPSKFTAGTVPQPTDPTMAIEAPASSYKAVYGPFGGFPGQSDYEADLKKLQASVAAAGIKLANDKDITYAGYSSPFTILGRHQEVWLDVAGPAVESA